MLMLRHEYQHIKQDITFSWRKLPYLTPEYPEFEDRRWSKHNEIYRNEYVCGANLYT